MTDPKCPHCAPVGVSARAVVTQRIVVHSQITRMIPKAREQTVWSFAQGTSNRPHQAQCCGPGRVKGPSCRTIPSRPLAHRCRVPPHVIQLLPILDVPGQSTVKPPMVVFCPLTGPFIRQWKRKKVLHRQQHFVTQRGGHRVIDQPENPISDRPHLGVGAHPLNHIPKINGLQLHSCTSRGPKYA